MTRIDWIAWLGMVAALLLIGPCRAGNLAPDPGFETAGPGGSPAGWHAWGGSTDASPAQQDRNRPHTGEACLRVTNPPGGSHFYTASDTIPADPGQCYLLTAWGRADREKAPRFASCHPKPPDRRDAFIEADK